PDYIPRPANAFMLFRSDFIRRKHVPDGIQTSQDTLSRIVSQCWHALPEDQKAPWKVKAEHEKAEHAKKYPGYVYRPNHSKT
ncbi:HMG-box, partial [Stereum hirsutum FP-91666 SS1]|uniref:HMG-box n=1 Tax=Stereum hirsutum (strain FP-91666) TaxID=721885 RepID=UPI000440F42C